MMNGYIFDKETIIQVNIRSNSQDDNDLFLNVGSMMLTSAPYHRAYCWCTGVSRHPSKSECTPAGSWGAGWLGTEGQYPMSKKASMPNLITSKME